MFGVRIWHEGSASLAHPLLFDRPRRGSLTPTEVERREVALRVPVIVPVSAGQSVEFAFFAGPTLFNASQDIVTGVGFTQGHPFGSAELTRARTATRFGSGVGFHGGAEVAYFLSALAGVGGKVRFSRAELDPGWAHRSARCSLRRRQRRASVPSRRGRSGRPVGPSFLLGRCARALSSES